MALPNTSRWKGRCWSSISSNTLNFARSYFKKAKSRSLLSRQCNRRARCSYRKNLLIVVVYRTGYFFVYCIKLPRSLLAAPGDGDGGGGDDGSSGRFHDAERPGDSISTISRFDFRHCYVHYRDFPLAIPSVGTLASIKYARDAGYVKFTVLFLAIHRRAKRETHPLYTPDFLPYNSILHLYICRMHSGKIDTFFLHCKLRIDSLRKTLHIFTSLYSKIDTMYKYSL